jgi:REP element-mobilizing transposase RayT
MIDLCELGHSFIGVTFLWGICAVYFIMNSRKIIRLKGHDYSKEGYYFVTIEPVDHEYSFCKIADGEIHLNEIGKIIDKQWNWLFDQYDYIRNDAFVIMPDHIHGIIRILPASKGNVRAGLGPPSDYSAIKQRAAQVPPVPLVKRKRYTLSQMIGAFKSKSSTRIRKAGYKNYKWKRSFHDRIIRDDELEIKRNYIKNNPKNWKEVWR